MDIVPIEKLNKGDTIMIQGNNDECMIVTVSELHEGVILIKELGGMDYAPEDPENIVRLAEENDEAIIFPLSNRLHFKLNKEWEKIFKSKF